MNFFKLRMLNIFLLSVIGVLFSFVIKNKYFPSKKENIQISAPQESIPISKAADFADDSEDEDSDEEQEYNVFDDDDIENIPIPSKLKKQKILEEELVEEEGNERTHERFIDLGDSFFKNPERFENEIVDMELKMIFAKKIVSGWLFNLMRIDSRKNIHYIYIKGESDLVAEPNFKIGYFYSVSFKCSEGKPDKGNHLLSIKPTGKKAPWATGVSAVE